LGARGGTREEKEAQMPDVQEFLDTFVQQQEEADAALHAGDPEPRRRLWSRQDPVTVLGALGIVSNGWEECDRTFEFVASRFSNCERFRLEVIAAGVSGDLAYTVGYEHILASMDGGPVSPSRLRVTHVYRRENGEWKIAHRHGDALEDNPPPPMDEE
jgi:ketosteroid isomerase-like protein